jgi:Domain of Unknown Function (DUF1080)/FG-GAP-like repeat
MPAPRHTQFLASLILWPLGALAQPCVTWQTQTLSREFHGEGAAVADFDHDGARDIVSGPSIYFGPDFKRSLKIYDLPPVDVKSYSKNFLTYAHDISGDGWADVIVMGFPGELGYWFQNPAGKNQDLWKRWDVFTGLDNESPTFLDITGDGKPEIICSNKERWGFAEPNWADPVKPWDFTPISAAIPGLQRFTHGLGIGDVNKDGRTDLLEKTGWREQPANHRLQPEWHHHPAPFGSGGSQMFVYDFDGDGDNDVLSTLVAHGYGVAWFENTDGVGTAWQEHLIIGETSATSPSGVAFSQPHAIDIADFNGDGVIDFVTGKRWYAHNGGDPGGMESAVLYWFETKRLGAAGKVQFIPHFVDDDSGVGCQVVAMDINGDKRPDIVVGNKKGTFVHLQRPIETDADGWRPLFDGTTLTGWDGDPAFWSVVNGEIIAESTPAKPCTKNSFMTWRGGKVADFEFKANFRLTGVESANSGIQFRAQDEGGFKVVGYQADIDNKANYLGVLWDEDGRGLLGARGKKTRISRQGVREEVEVAPEATIHAALKPGEWNEYHIIASGSDITLKVNGVVTTQVTDLQATEYDGHGKVIKAEPHQREGSGWLALQLHSGGPTKVQWKNLQFRELAGHTHKIVW